MARHFLLVALLASVATAQTKDRFDFGTVGGGLTTGTPGDPFDDAYLSLAGDYHVVRGRLYVRGGVSFQGEVLGPDRVTEGHVTAGLAAREGAALFTLSAGPTLAWVVRTSFEEGGTAFVGRYEGWAVGAHASAAVHVAVVQEVTFGLEAFANVNTQTPVAGARLTFGLGRLPRPLACLPDGRPSRPTCAPQRALEDG